VQTLLDARVSDGRAMGLAVSLIEPDGRVRFFNAGTLSRGGSEVNADTIFEIGSITKAFTGVLLGQAVGRGAINLEDAVRTYAPAGVQLPPGSAGDITVRQLATHTSGLPRLPMSWPFLRSMLSDPGNPYKAYSEASLWRYLTEHRHDSRVAHQAEYSNLGFGVLGELLAVRASLSYAELVQRDIASPLAMRNTQIEIRPDAVARFATGHDAKLASTGYWDLPAMAGAGALRSTSRDLATFMRAVQSGTLSGALVSTQPHAAFGARRAIGLGWIRSERAKQTIVWHNGGTGGFSSFAGYSEASGLGVVILSNAAVSVDDIGMHLLDPDTPLAAKAPSGGTSAWIAVLIALSVWLASVVAPWRLRFGAPPKSAANDLDAAEPTSSASRARRSESKWTRFAAPRYVTSRADSFWVALELALVGVLLGVFGPWGTLGAVVKWVVVSSLLVSAAAVPFRAWQLPWRDPAPISKSKLVGRMFTGLLAVGVGALWLV
jgi:serine-type D-Ala-D-Ala carboxypeptidase/endopeptidase